MRTYPTLLTPSVPMPVLLSPVEDRGRWRHLEDLLAGTLAGKEDGEYGLLLLIAGDGVRHGAHRRVLQEHVAACSPEQESLEGQNLRIAKPHTTRQCPRPELDAQTTWGLYSSCISLAFEA